MGVKKLNILINAYKNKPEEVPNEFLAGIVDGNNLLITFLQSAVKNLRGGLDIIEQTENILCAVYERIIKEFDKFVRVFNMREIWVVFDPRKKLEYNIDSNIFDLIDEEYFNEKYKASKFQLSSKEEEHLKRERGRLYSEKVFEDPKEKEYYGFQNQRIANKLIKILQKTIVSASRHTNGTDWIGETPDYLSEKFPMTESYSLYVVQGEFTEADLVIKNLVETLNIINPDKNFLIISKDTDYKILFSNNFNVWCSDLNCRKFDIVSPFIIWRNFFKPLLETPEGKDFDIFEGTIRLAPLIGNDYTANYPTMITLKDCDDINLSILRLFSKNIDTQINTRTNLGRFLKKFSYEKTLDENLKEYDKKLYGVYIESVMIYKNWLMFGNDYAINTKKIDFDENLELVYKFVLKNEFGETIEAHDEKEFVKKFYNIRKNIADEWDGYFDEHDTENTTEEISKEKQNKTISTKPQKQIIDDFDGYFD